MLGNILRFCCRLLTFSKLFFRIMFSGKLSSHWFTCCLIQSQLTLCMLGTFSGYICRLRTFQIFFSNNSFRNTIISLVYLLSHSISVNPLYAGQIFKIFCRLLAFFKINFLKEKIFQEYYQRVE